MFRVDERHTGIYSSVAPAAAPIVKWKFKTFGPITSSATVKDDKIYFGSADGYMYCLDKSSGKKIWHFLSKGPIKSTALVTDDAVYFGSYDGNFYSLDSKTGSLRWSFATAGEQPFSARGIHGALPRDSIFKDPWDFFLSSPCLKDDMVFFGTGSGVFYALNKNDGLPLWTYKTNNVIHSSPVVDFGNVYFGSWDTYFYSINAKTGKLVWKFKTGIDTTMFNQTGIQGSATISDSTIYFGCRDSHLYALSALTGTLKWKRSNDYSWVSSTPVVDKEKILYTTGDGAKFVALNKYSGSILFQKQVRGWVFSSPSVANGKAYFGDMNGFLNCFDISSGDSAWSYQLEASKADRYKILLKNGKLNTRLVFSDQKRRYEKMSSMDMLFSLGSIHASPVIENGTLYFGSTDGNFYALAGKKK